MEHDLPTYAPGDQVRSQRFGLGRVEYDKGPTAIIRFEHGLEELEKKDLVQIPTSIQAIDLRDWHAPLEVITRVQAETIQSVNDTWGVFSMSRISLLPHQLWVCRQVLQTWPTRWLVADDVGLGKTIEGGLILSPLLARGTAQRVLVICPASLVEQWIIRLREMFDIRMAMYSPEVDTPQSDFWTTHNQVVVSLHTIRADNRGRHQRLFESPPWDLVMVDEAHHLNWDEKSGPTLGYELIEAMNQRSLAKSMIFFTGTPHRGKDFGFLALLSLLHPSLFDPQEPLWPQLPHLREVMIRNNKQNVTDLKGNRLFRPPLVTSETYHYSQKEEQFYDMLTEFILTGKAYASSLSLQKRQSVMLVLIAMQKIASSSVAAIRRALRGRLSRMEKRQQELDDLTDRHNKIRERELNNLGMQTQVTRYNELEQFGDADELSRLEEEIAERSVELRLMQDEQPRLRELVKVAEMIQDETKISKIIDVVTTRFAGRSIVFFTEYKATQSLLMSILIRHFGEGCVTFINGDGRAEEVIDSSGRETTLFESREYAAEKFNKGRVQFLVSTEAGGEGIDLQERSHTLIHVDLPWNPMRLHQRVGRLNRYGQTHQVEVLTLRNPGTVESLIWDRLNAKINNVMRALDRVMEEPEDLLQLVLGMTSSSLFRDVFQEAQSVPRESLSKWFDEKTAQFGGQEVIETVRALVGHSARFDFQQVAPQLPRLDLPDLRPFIQGMLALNGRRVRTLDNGLSFKTPDAWLDDPAVMPNYENMVFDRNADSERGATRILGVGHRLFDQALKQAKAQSVSVATLPASVLSKPIFIFRISDQVTDTGASVRSVTAAIEMDPTGSEPETLLQDSKLLKRLNEILASRSFRTVESSPQPSDPQLVAHAAQQAAARIMARIPELDLSFKVPLADFLAILWPVSAGRELSSESMAITGE